MKKLTIAFLFVIALIAGLTNLKAEESKNNDITFVQCVVVDNEVKSCTDITDGTMFNIKEVTNKWTSKQ